MSRQSIDCAKITMRLVLASLLLLAACLAGSGCMEPAENESPADRWLKSADADKFADQEATVPRKRFLSVIGLNPEDVERYRQLHKNIPPGLENALHASGISNYSVFVKLIDDQFYALRYYEFTGTDHEVAIARLDVDPAYRQFRDAYEACQVPVSPRTSGQWWASLEEICHID